MALTPTAAWLAAAEQTPNEPRVLFEIHDGTNTWRCIDDLCDQLTDDVALIDTSPIAAELDPFTRAVQTGTVVVRVADAWIRSILVGNRLSGQRVRIWQGFKSIAEGDFLRVFTGTITPGGIRPQSDANLVELECLDVFGQLETRDVTGWWFSMHPLEVIEDILTKAGIPASLIDSTSLDPSDASNATISHYVISRGPTKSWRDDPWTWDLVIRDPVPAWDLCNEIAILLNGHFVANEDGLIGFAHFDSAAAAEDNWDTEVIGEFSQRELDSNIVNEIAVSFARNSEKTYKRDLTRGDQTSQAAFAYPGEATRVLSEHIETPWLDSLWTLIGDMTDAQTDLGIRGGNLHAITGLHYPGFPAGAQPAWAKISATRPAYFLITAPDAAEIVKATVAVTVDSAWRAKAPILDDPDGSGDATTFWYPYMAHFASGIARGQLGTTPVAHKGVGAGTVAVLWDITIPLTMILSRLERFSMGAPVVEITTPISKSWLQYGDLVTLDHPDFIGYGLDGITSGDGKWEIVLKEVSQHESPPRIRWVLVSATVVAPNYTTPIMAGAGPRIDTVVGAVADEDVARAFRATGLATTDDGALKGTLAPGTISSGTVRSYLPGLSSESFTPSRDTYILHDLYTGAIVFGETALGAGAPDMDPGETAIAKVITDAVEITSVDQSAMPLTAIDGVKLIEDTVDTPQLAALAVTSAELEALAVTTAKLDNLAVTEGKIGGLAVTEGKIGLLAVTNGKIGLLSVDTPQIAAQAVENAKLGLLSVDTPQIAVSAVETAQLAPLAVTNAEIGNATIGVVKLDLAQQFGGSLNANAALTMYSNG